MEGGVVPLDLFAANGYINTTIEQICSTAFVGTKSFYEVFENREDCYLALLKRTSERLEADMMVVAQKGVGNEKQALPALIAAFAHGLMDDPRVARVTFGIAAGTAVLWGWLAAFVAAAAGLTVGIRTMLRSAT